MAKFDVLFIGLGPISHQLAKLFTQWGLRVAAITRGIESFSTEAAYDTISWSDAVGHRIISETTYLSWRELPIMNPLGELLVSWITSESFRTRRIIHLSSASVYPPSTTPSVESDFLSEVFGSAGNPKQSLERFVTHLASENGVDFSNYRLSNVYGNPLNFGFIADSIENIISGEPLNVFSGADLVRDYIHIQDVVVAISALHGADFKHGAVNISSGRGVKTSQILCVLEDLVGGGLMVNEVEMAPRIPKVSVLDSKLLSSLISWNPVPIEEAIPAELYRKLKEA
jgi:nucleoside-diphosphate-sugar epimerase